MVVVAWKALLIVLSAAMNRDVAAVPSVTALAIPSSLVG